MSVTHKKDSSYESIFSKNSNQKGQNNYHIIRTFSANNTSENYQVVYKFMKFEHVICDS